MVVIVCVAPQWGAADAEIKVPSSENTELKRALKKSNDSSVGPDDIHYKLLTNLPESSLTRC